MTMMMMMMLMRMEYITTEMSDRVIQTRILPRPYSSSKWICCKLWVVPPGFRAINLQISIYYGSKWRRLNIDSSFLKVVRKTQPQQQEILELLVGKRNQEWIPNYASSTPYLPYCILFNIVVFGEPFVDAIFRYLTGGLIGQHSEDYPWLWLRYKRTRANRLLRPSGLGPESGCGIVKHVISRHAPRSALQTLSAVAMMMIKYEYLLQHHDQKGKHKL